MKLHDTYAANLESVLLPKNKWQPCPRFNQRDAWTSVSEGRRKYCLDRAELAFSEAWPVLHATDYLEFTRTGNRTGFQTPFFARRRM